MNPDSKQESKKNTDAASVASASFDSPLDPDLSHPEISLQSSRRDAGLLYDVYGVKDGHWSFARQTMRQIAQAPTEEEAQTLLRVLVPNMSANAHIVLPFYCDLGHRIYIGEHSMINMDGLMLDEGKIVIGNHVLIGPRCSFYTPVHPMDRDIRKTGLEKALPIVIEDHVWIAGSCVINGGVTIHEGSVIGSGSVVVDDIPCGVFAAGNPCRVIRVLDENDRKATRQEYEDWKQACRAIGR